MSVQSDVQVVKRIRAKYSKLFPRFNFQTSISFSLNRQHVNPSDAAAFILNHPFEIPVSLEDGTPPYIHFMIPNETGAIISSKKMKGIIQASDGEQLGATTIHSYTILGEELEISSLTA